MSLTLILGNKAYSSWSLRPWLALKMLGIPFAEKFILLHQKETRAEVQAEGGPGTVPLLRDGEILVWESLAILDYLDETHAGGRLWPQERAARAFARSISAEMHSGFSALRSHCPMNVRRRLEPYALSADAQADVDRIAAIWVEARQRFGQGNGDNGGPFLFGAFSAADAMYAPVVMRLHFYVVPVSPVIRAYMDTILALPVMQEWIAAAHEEPWVLEDSERY